MMSGALPEPKKFSELTPEEQPIARAIYTGSIAERMDYRFVVEKGYQDEHVTEWHVFTCSRFGEKMPVYRPFCVDTVEDHGTHYRVRGDGRHDGWHTVVKK